MSTLRVTGHEWFGGFEIHLHVISEGRKATFAADVGGDPAAGSAITYFWHVNGDSSLMSDLDAQCEMTAFVKRQIGEETRQDEPPAPFLTNGTLMKVRQRTGLICYAKGCSQRESRKCA